MTSTSSIPTPTLNFWAPRGTYTQWKLNEDKWELGTMPAPTEPKQSAGGLWLARGAFRADTLSPWWNSTWAPLSLLLGKASSWAYKDFNKC